MLNFYISNKATPRNTKNRAYWSQTLSPIITDYKILNVFGKRCNYNLISAATSKTIAASEAEKLQQQQQKQHVYKEE